ncbi:MAG: hypothetical protein GXP55_21550, partial [Deltaproteobacteria bacterium]|nr:hypothetical protein [Deltaproteobacteria bacterium]
MRRILALVTVTASAVAPGVATGQTAEAATHQAVEVAQPPSSAPSAAVHPEAGEPAHNPVERDATKLALARALDERMTVWRAPSGRRVYVRSCRRARGVRGGCRARIAALVQL